MISIRRVRSKILMRAVQLRGAGTVLACLCVTIFTSGCGDKPLPAKQTSQRVGVTVVSEDGDFSLVRRDDGEEVYVFTDDVRAKSGGSGATHSVRVDTDIFQGSPPPAPRTQGKISWARRESPLLFLTERTRRRVVRDRLTHSGFVDEQTRERCFVAYVCNNPDCPAREADSQLNLFPQGGSAYAQAFEDLPSTSHTLGNVCPDCLSLRDVQNETDKQRSQYRNWVKRYILSEERQHHETLDKENRYRIRLLRKDAGWSPPE